MAEESSQKDFGPKKRLTKTQAVAVMVIGIVILLLPMIIPSEQGSTLHVVKVVVGVAGLAILFVGLYLRP